MNPGKEKAPEGAQMMTNHDTAMPDSQGFLEAKEWLAKRFCECRHSDLAVHWDASQPWCQIMIRDAWAVLVAMLGEESARMFLMSKYDTVKGGRNG